jgi:hypothetical protein
MMRLCAGKRHVVKRRTGSRAAYDLAMDTFLAIVSKRDTRSYSDCSTAEGSLL